jgi:hypothetical protein
MMNRVEIDRLLRELYAARVRGDLEAVCRIFADDVKPAQAMPLGSPSPLWASNSSISCYP